MTIPELISKLEKEIATVNKRKSDSASNNFIIRCEERVSAISDFILDLKNLNEETRKDFGKRKCEHWINDKCELEHCAYMSNASIICH